MLTPAQSAASGFVAACIGPILNNPFDVVKTRMQAASKGGPHYKGFGDCLMTIARTEGIPALWKGLIPRLARTPPGQAIVWTVSDQVGGWGWGEGVVGIRLWSEGGGRAAGVGAGGQAARALLVGSTAWLRQKRHGLPCWCQSAQTPGPGCPSPPVSPACLLLCARPHAGPDLQSHVP